MQLNNDAIATIMSLRKAHLTDENLLTLRYRDPQLHNYITAIEDLLVHSSASVCLPTAHQPAHAHQSPGYADRMTPAPPDFTLGYSDEFDHANIGEKYRYRPDDRHYNMETELADMINNEYSGHSPATIFHGSDTKPSTDVDKLIVRHTENMKRLAERTGETTADTIERLQIADRLKRYKQLLSSCR